MTMITMTMSMIITIVKTSMTAAMPDSDDDEYFDDSCCVSDDDDGKDAKTESRLHFHD